MLTRRAFTLLALSAPFARPAFANSPETFADAGLAIRGVDPVAYFAGNGPVMGTQANTLMWKGTYWQFASAENREAFEMSPDRYAPAYGGYCAYAMSLGHLAPTDPAAWTIHNDRLYLNFSTEVRAIWQADVPGNITKADGFWPDVLNG